jgi:hypothetical protein
MHEYCICIILMAVSTHTGNVFPKIVFHEKQYFYVPPTLLGDIQKGDTKFSAYDIRMFLEYK